MSQDLAPPPPLHAGAALFLDLDGTLAPIEQTPSQVGPVARRTRLLARLNQRLGGAVAVLSGRTIEDIDRIIEDGCTAIAGVHGLARRTAQGKIVQSAPSAGLAHARSVLTALAVARKGLLLEDKLHSLALHYRLAPAAEAAVRDSCDRLAEQDELVIQHGEMVCELRTPGPTKGDALRAFLLEPPFKGRTPVMVGDDLTDEHGFAAASACGGFGVLVGAPRDTAARYRLDRVESVLDWLETEREIMGE